MNRTLVPVVFFVACLLHGTCVAAAENWPGFRGPARDGQYQGPPIPTKWDASAVAWKVPLKGFGQSSPVVWGERIFLTTATDGGQRRWVLCLSRHDGKLLWEQEAKWSGTPERLHNMNSHASATCVTDGEVVVAFFGRAGLHGFSLDGKPLWSRDLGTFEGPWGTAASPLIVGDLVIQNCDADKDACLVGVDKRSGEVKWKTPRPNFRGWSTPILVEAAGRKEVAVNGHTALLAYDPATGKELWKCRNGSGRGDPSVVAAGGVLFNVCGLAAPMVSVRAGGEGDVTDSRVNWTAPRRGGRDLPSPLVVGDHLLVSTMSGIVNCYQTASGKQEWSNKVSTSTVSASPIAADGKAYFLNEKGETFVIRAAEKLELVATHRFATHQNAEDEHEIFRASLVPHAGQVLIRSDKRLYCIGKPAAQ